MKRLPVCGVQGCEETALVVDFMGNMMCFDCMESEIADTGTTGDDYEDIDTWMTSQETPLAVQ